MEVQEHFYVFFGCSIVSIKHFFDRFAIESAMTLALDFMYPPETWNHKLRQADKHLKWAERIVEESCNKVLLHGSVENVANLPQVVN